MQEFSSFTVKKPGSFDERVSSIASSLDHSPEIAVDLSTVEALLTSLVAGQVVSNAQLLTAVEQLIEQSSGDEFRLRELKIIRFHLADMTDNFIEEVD